MTMYGQTIGVRSHNLGDLILQLKQGLPVGSLSQLSRQLGISESRLADTISIAQRTLTRRKKEGRFKTDESERVLRIARLFERAIEVLGSDQAARQWFQSPVKGLGNKTPLEFADTEPGAQEVGAMLDRIEDGVFF
ncbi:MAG: antitoxin Xre/MbcA/ParS toxin-binding domain-containing protein [Pseudomonadota bacterium]